MALDTRDRRASAIGFVLAFRLIGPNPSGSLDDEAKRAQMAYSYAGVLPVPPVVVPPQIYARFPYSAPQAPQTYDPQWTRTQLSNIARSLAPASIRNVTTDTRVMATDDVIWCDTTAGDITVTLLPAGQLKFLPVTIKNVGVGTVTIAGTVDGTVNPTLAQWEAWKIMSNGMVWGLLSAV